MVAFAAGPASAATWRVPPGDAERLAAALHRARPGDRIELAGGRYLGNFRVSVPLTLTAASPTTLTSAGRGTILALDAPAVVSGLTLRESGHDITAQDACILVNPGASGSTLRDNRLERCGWGVWVERAPNVTIRDNVVVGTTEPIFSDRGNGIHLYAVVGGLVAGNRIRFGRDGIYISNSTGVVIRGNRMERLRFGIHYMYSHGCTVVGNATYASMVGAALMYSKHLVVRDNHLEGNQGHGMLLRDVLYSEIVGNRSLRNRDGLYLGSSYFNLIRRNRFAHNEIAAEVSNGSSRNKVYENDFVHNRLPVKFMDRKTIVWSYEGRGNYWSHYRGWDRDGDGIGDRPFVVTRLVDKLIYRYPILRLMLASPAFDLLVRIENDFPVVSGPVIVDEYPLMRPATGGST